MTPWTVAGQAPLSMGFSRQEYWSRLPFPSPGEFPDPGIEPVSPTLPGGFFTECWQLQVPSIFYEYILFHSGFLGGSVVKNPPAVRETSVRSLGWEDPLEKGLATLSSILAWKSHGQRSLAGYSPWGRKESSTTERLNTSPHLPSALSNH